MTDTLCDFAVACYRRSGVAACCLRLQDSAGADINMLLAAAWLSEQRRRWQRNEARELIRLCANWRKHCVLPLRALRRHLKDQTEQTKQNTTQKLYGRAKKLELEAEMHQLYLIHIALQSAALKIHSGTFSDALAANLQIYFDCITSEQQFVDADCQALIAALHR